MFWLTAMSSAELSSKPARMVETLWACWMWEESGISWMMFSCHVTLRSGFYNWEYRFLLPIWDRTGASRTLDTVMWGVQE